MGYSDQSEYPKGRSRVVDLSDTAQTLLAAGRRWKVRNFVFTGGTAAEIVVLRAVDDSPVVLRVHVPAVTTLSIPGWEVDGEGIEVLTESTAGDVEVAAFFH